MMHWITKPATSRQGMFRITSAVCKEFLSVPGIRSCGSHIGRAIGGPEIVGMNFAENWLSIDPKANYEETMAKIHAVSAAYPGVYAAPMTFIRERVKEVLTGESETMVVRIYGTDLNVLAAKADEVERSLASVPGLLNLKKQTQIDNPHVQITVDLAKAAQHGLHAGEVRRAAGSIMNGVEVTDVFREGRIFGVVIWSRPEFRNSLDSVKDMLIDAPGGKHVRLGDVAEVKIMPTPNQILRDEFSRRIDVSANVAPDRDLVQVAEEVKQRVRAINLPIGYRVDVLGEHVERQQSLDRLRWVTIAVTLGILVMLQVSFRSWPLALLTFLALPAALIGGVLSAYAGGGIVSLGSLVGMLTVLGIAARNGILLIHHYQFLEEEENMPFGLELVIRGALERLSPILMTSLCTGLALVPLVFAGQLPGHEIEHPMAVVIVGGLITSTILNLLVVPVLYLLFGGKRASNPNGVRAGAAVTA